MYTSVKESDLRWLDLICLIIHEPTIAVFVARNSSCASVNTPFSDLLQLGVIGGLWGENVYGDASVVLKVALQRVSPKRHGV